MATLNKISVDNVVYDIGGSAECLIVTLDNSATTASHSPAEIRQALLKGIPAYLKSADIYSDGEGTALFIPIHYAETNGLHPEYNIAVATFVDTISSEGIEYIQTVTIKEDKSVEIKTTSAVNELELESYLSKTNTTEYTPSADYHPATKKYVDDHAGPANIIKTGITDPNTETVGNFVGQIYCNTRKDTAYQLVSITKIDGETYYNWTKLVRGNDKVTSLSSNPTDEQYPSAKAVKDYVANYKLKGDFAVIEGSHVLTANTEEKHSQNSSMQTQWQIDFPSGFNKDNCVCLCFGAKSYEDRCYSYGFNTSASLGIVKGTVERTIMLGWNQDTTKINLEAFNMATTEKTLWYRIVLMKI